MSRLEETLALDRRRFLRASLVGGALLLTGAGLIGLRLYAAANMPVGKPGKVLRDIFGDDGRHLGARNVPRLVMTARSRPAYATA